MNKSKKSFSSAIAQDSTDFPSASLHSGPTLKNIFSDRPIGTSKLGIPFYRPVWAEISHENLKHNFLEIARQLPPKVSILAVVKANAYGHGLVPVSKTLSQCKADFLGVTSIEEALTLKKSKVPNRILILGNSFPFSSLELSIKNQIRITVASLESAKMCATYAQKLCKKAYIHAKIDTGMGRMGVNVKNGLSFIKALRGFPHLKLEGVFTHFSSAVEDPGFTRNQFRLFKTLAEQLRKNKIEVPYFHCDNSAGLIRVPESNFSMVRPGIALYGVNHTRTKKINLKPVLSWKSRIVFLKQVPAGTPVSYDRTYFTKRKSKIATAAFGYADGFRRSLSNNAWVLVRGKRVPVIGRVTMDMTMLDVTALPDAKVGDEVVLVGQQGRENISIEELAKWAKTSPYEMFCGIAPRVPRINLF